MSVDVAPHNMTDHNVPSPYVVSESSYLAPWRGWRLFDGEATANTKWIVGTSGQMWVVLDFGAGISHTISSFAIMFDSDGPWQNRAPKNFFLAGSGNNVTYDTTATVTNQTGWSNGETRTFNCDVITTAYRYIKIQVTANNGDPVWMQFNELYLYESDGKIVYLPLSTGGGAKHICKNTIADIVYVKPSNGSADLINDQAGIQLLKNQSIKVVDYQSGKWKII